MKKIFLVRHAKSSWDSPELSDFERPLNKRGKRDAPFMAKLLARQGVSPDIIITSPANRAITTARYFCEELGFSFSNVFIEPKLYMADSDHLLEILKELNDKFSNVMVFSHNPGLTDFANYLVGKGIDNIPTCGILSINSKVEAWNDLSPNNCNIISFEYPKKYFK
jgi:phosphohistidine phosphatase